MKMGSTIDEEYMTMFLEFFRYMLYLKDEKKKVQRFISGLPLAFKDWIEYDEPQSLEEFNGNLNHFYEKSKHKIESKQGGKGNYKAKGKWPSKKERTQDACEKEIVSPYNNFNVVEKRR